MEVTCVFYGPLREAVGTKTVVVEIDEGTVGDLLGQLVDAHPDLKDELFDGDDLADNLVITLDRTHVQHLDDLDTPVAEGNTLRLTPAFIGG